MANTINTFMGDLQWLAPMMRRQIASTGKSVRQIRLNAASLVLIGVFVGIYRLLVRPKSLGSGLALGAFVGLALGVSVGLGTFIHMPIPPAVAWGWFVGGWLKGLVAGAIVGAVIVES